MTSRPQFNDDSPRRDLLTAEGCVVARQEKPFDPDILFESPVAVALELMQAGIEAAARTNSVLAVQTALARAQACKVKHDDLDKTAILEAARQGNPDPESNIVDLIEKMHKTMELGGFISHPDIDSGILAAETVAAAQAAYHAISDLGDLVLARRLARNLSLSLDFEDPSLSHPSQPWRGVADKAGWHLLRRQCPGFAGHGTETAWQFAPGLVVDRIDEDTPWFNVVTGVMSIAEAARAWRYVGRLDLAVGPAVRPVTNAILPDAPAERTANVSRHRPGR